MIHLAAGNSARRQWSAHLDGMDLFPVHSGQKCHQLRMVKTDTSAGLPWPAEAIFLKDFCVKADACPIPPNNPDPVCSLRPEDKKRATEGVKAAVPNQGHQRRGSFAEVDRLARHVDHNNRSDHACRTALTMPLSNAGSIEALTRSVASPTFIATVSVRTASKRVKASPSPAALRR
jgi:hypothetical protein